MIRDKWKWLAALMAVVLLGLFLLMRAHLREVERIIRDMTGADDPLINLAFESDSSPIVSPEGDTLGRLERGIAWSADGVDTTRYLFWTSDSMDVSEPRAARFRFRDPGYVVQVIEEAPATDTLGAVISPTERVLFWLVP